MSAKEREPFKGDAGDIEETESTEDPINELQSKCSDPACHRGTIDRYRDTVRICPCLYQARVELWLHLIQFKQPVDTSPLLAQRSTGRLLIRGSTWATTTRHLARTLLDRGLSASLNSPVVKGHKKIEVVRLTHLVDAVMRSKSKFAPYARKVLIVRTTAGSARQKEVNAECLHEFLMFCEDHRACVWLVDEPSERLAEGHRAWSPDVAKALKEMNFVEVEVEPAPDLDFSLLDRSEHLPPPRMPPPARTAYVHPDPNVRFPNGATPTSAVDAAGMLAPRPRGAGPAGAHKSKLKPDPPLVDAETEQQMRDHIRGLHGNPSRTDSHDGDEADRAEEDLDDDLHVSDEVDDLEDVDDDDMDSDDDTIDLSGV
jgi:hypothetical protein